MRLRTAISVALCLLILGAPFAAEAEIPHENFDLVGSDLDMLIDLLRSSIDYSEYTLESLIGEYIAGANDNMSIVNGLLDPAEQLLQIMMDVVESYENLSRLMPPFLEFAQLEEQFIDMEASLISERDFIRSLSGYVNLTDEQTLAAMGSIGRANSLLVRMDGSIDAMVESANEISALEVDGSMPFADNDLLELIEQLRGLLYMIELELLDFLRSDDDPSGTGENPWKDVSPFLVLWLEEETVYLGESIRGGVYLFFNGSFQEGRFVQIDLDGLPLSTGITDSDGELRFEFEVPVNESWLGSHVLTANSSSGWEELYSDPVTVTVSLIPTEVRIEIEATLLTLDDQLNISAIVTDIFGRPVENGNCVYHLNADGIAFVTDEFGENAYSWDASEIGLGKHTVWAEFLGHLPYAPSSSVVAELTINIPTKLDLNLFSDRFALGYKIVGNGTIFANQSEPIDGAIITIFVDGEFETNVSSDDRGIFSYSIESIELSTGTHTITAIYLFREGHWRYSEDSQSFTIYVPKASLKYPFWPYLPRWGGISPPQDFVNLFFGDYAYYTWLLILLAAGTVVKTLQIRKSRRESSSEEQGEGEPIVEPTIVPAGAEALQDELGAVVKRTLEAPSNPNDRIVWYYNRLISILKGERRIGIRDSMTHWEIARMLGSLGYSYREVERATLLFEIALYSGSELSGTESEEMTRTVEEIIGTGGGEPDAA